MRRAAGRRRGRAEPPCLPVGERAGGRGSEGGAGGGSAPPPRAAVLPPHAGSSGSIATNMAAAQSLAGSRQSGGREHGGEGLRKLARVLSRTRFVIGRAARCVRGRAGLEVCSAK